MRIVIDSKDLKRYKADLNKMSRSAYPIAVRNTLNNAAFEMKKNQLHKAAKDRFEYTRAKNFFKRFSYVNKSFGYNINRMQSKVGMRDLGQKSAKAAVQNMDMHEKGGTITKGSMYLESTRITNKRGRLVRTKQRLRKGMVIKNPKGTFVQKAINASMRQKPFWHKAGGLFYLIKVDSFTKTAKGISFKSSVLMRQRQNARIKPNKFISLAARKTEAKIPNLYKIEFEKQLRRYVGRKNK